MTASHQDTGRLLALRVVERLPDVPVRTEVLGALHLDPQIRLVTNDIGLLVAACAVGVLRLPATIEPYASQYLARLELTACAFGSTCCTHLSTFYPHPIGVQWGVVDRA